MKKLICALPLCTALTIPSLAHADTHWNPSLSGEVVIELQNEYTADSDDSATDDYNDIFLRTEVAPTLMLTDKLFIDGVAVLERTQDREPNEDNFFDNEGIFIEELKLNYENGAWGFMAGKFNPQFGRAWDFGRGIWSEDFAEDYEITERIGLNSNYTFTLDNLGTHTLNASTFFADTTFLSGSAITNRGTTDKSDGGVSNTENFASFAFSIHSEDAGGIENLYYQLAYRDQAEGDADSGGDHEHGFAATLGYVFEVNEHLTTDALIEYVDIHNFEARAADNSYFSVSLVNHIYEDWNVAIG